MYSSQNILFQPNEHLDPISNVWKIQGTKEQSKTSWEQPDKTRWGILQDI